MEAQDSGSRGCRFESRFRHQPSPTSLYLRVVGSVSGPSDETKNQSPVCYTGVCMLKDPQQHKGSCRILLKFHRRLELIKTVENNCVTDVLSFLTESNPNFPWENCDWDNRYTKCQKSFCLLHSSERHHVPFNRLIQIGLGSLTVHSHFLSPKGVSTAVLPSGLHTKRCAIY